MILIIAEKPSVARDIAAVVGATNKLDGYLEGNGYQVSWALGHLGTLEDAAFYTGNKSWVMEELPIIPDSFKLKVISKGSKQFRVLKQLMNSCDSIIVATDAGREGELIFRRIYDLAGCNKPFQRLWISSMTSEAIKQGMANLKPGEAYDNLYYSANCRAEADWLVGINGTRSLTLSANAPSQLSVGRVQTPVIGLVTERFLENKNFVPSKYYVPSIQLAEKGVEFKATYSPKEHLSKEQADSILEHLRATIACTFSESKVRNEKQPLLFDLSTLQQAMDRKKGFKASKTLNLMQSLYEKHKVLTYPRTDSRYLTQDIYDTLPSVFNQIESFSNHADKHGELDMQNLPKVSVNDNKVSDHHAIIPTGKAPNGLSSDEQAVFDVVMTQFYAAFLPVCVKEVTTYQFGLSEKVIFQAKGVVIKEKGWRSVISDDKKEGEDNQTLPAVDKGQVLPVLKKSVVEKITKPKPLLTEGSLLRLMETAGKDVDDEELAQAMKDNGIGMPSTRASIIDKVLKVGYITNQKKHLVPTDLGLDLWKNVKDYDFAKPSLTGEWEFKLNKIAEGEYSADTFMNETKAYTQVVLDQLKLVGPNLGVAQKVSYTPQEINRTCPKCRSKLLDGKKVIRCENSPTKKGEETSCDFVFFKEIGGKDITPYFDKLLDGEKTPLIKGIKKKGGGTYDCSLFYDEEFKISREFPSNVVEGVKCPKCKTGNIKEGPKGFGCTNYSKDAGGCDFVVWKNGNAIKIDHVIQVIQKGRTGVIKGLKSQKTKKTFSASLVLDNNGAVNYEFEKKK